MREILDVPTAFGRKHIRTMVDLVIILIVTIIIFRNFIFSPQWPAGGDVLGYISREYLYWKDSRWLFVWRPNSFGYPEGVNLMDFFFMLLRFVAGNAANTTKIFAFSSFAFAGFAMYAFGNHCTRRNLPALAGSLVYILNGQFLTQLTEAHLDLMLSYAVAPLIFLFLDRALETGSMKNIVASSVLFGVMLTGFHPQMILIYGTFLCLFVVISLLRSKQSCRFRDLIKFRLKTIISIGAVVTVLSACFWIPLLFNVKAPYLSTTFSRGNLEDAYAYGYKSFAEALTLAGKESYGYVSIVDVTREASLQILPVPTILLVVFTLAYVTTLVLKLNRYSLFFGLSALVSIIFSMGPYSFESSFLWAWANIPYFQAFRAVSRWNLMTAFSNAFFVCVSTGILAGYLAETSHGLREKLEVKVNFHRDSEEPRSLRISLPGFTKVSHFARRSLYYSAILALAIMLMSGFFSTWFLFSKGLQVYTPPDNYIQPYDYLANISGEYKIITVGRSTSDWYSASGQDMDFVGGMLTPIGWSHDLGYDSTFIHDKPVLQDGGLLPLSTDFVNYLRFYLARNNITRNLLRLLGAFDYKYVVIPPYATENTRAFFESQYGGNLIYNQSNSIILENDFYTPRIFGPSQSALALGGPESLSSLFDIDTFDLSKVAVISANQAGNSPVTVDNHLNNITAIVFADAYPSDLMMAASNDTHFIYLADYGMQSSDTSAYWIKNGYWTNIGATVLGGRVLTTSGRNEINIPVELDAEGDFEIWIRAGFAPNRGKLLVSIDGLPLADVKPYSDFWSGLRWVNLTSSLHLETGSHLVTLLNDGTGYNDLDTIAIVDHSKLTHQAEEIINTFRNFTGKILYVLEAEKAFSTMLPERWSISAIPGEGYALHIDDSIDISHEALASASSVSGNYEAQYAIDSDLKTRWASSTDLPQWLEIAFPSPEEIDGVGISFEHAYAKDYRIQTWNGIDWTDQITVENNTLLDRQHTFNQSVTTEKLRIFVTSAPAYGMVSIWDLQTYSDHDVPSSRIFVPREGEYRFAARLVSDGESNGTFYLKVDDKKFSIACSTNESKVAWFELGSTILNAGEHNISVYASGSVTLDKVGIYSASHGELLIHDVFNPNLSGPSVTYEEINPCRYIVHVNCTEPFLLIFSESYHSSWKAYVDNKEISSIIVNSLANGFSINETGSFDVVLYFTGQEVANVGLLISGIGVIFVISVVLVKSGPARRAWRFLMNRRLLKES